MDDPRPAPSGLAVGAIFAGWALAQRPDFLPDELTLEDAAANDTTLTATLIALVALQGRLPGRFRPIVSDEGIER